MRCISEFHKKILDFYLKSELGGDFCFHPLLTISTYSRILNGILSVRYMMNMLDREMLCRKLLATCPICKKQIYGFTLGLQTFDLSPITSFPFAYTYVHTHNHCSATSPMPPLHAITLYFDANMAVRAIENSKMVKIDN